MVDRCLSPCLLATSLDHILALYIAIGFISTYPHIGDLHIGDLHIGDLHIGDLHIMPCMWCVLLFHLNGDMVSTEEMGNVNADILISVLVVT